MSIKNWKRYLTDWNSQILDNNKYIKKYHVLKSFPDIQSNKGIYKGANMNEVDELEKRLKTHLPSSYKNFLMASNGWSHITMGVNFYGTNDIDWFYKTDKQWVDEWIDSAPDDEIADEEYYCYGEEQLPENIRNIYMKDLLKISEDLDGYVFLLNPNVKTSDGEWEAWAFGTKLPGAYRYQSFEEMMRAEKKQALTEVEEESSLLTQANLNFTRILFLLLLSPLILVNYLFVYTFKLFSWIGSIFKTTPKA